jgi:hypothetical protein
VIISDEHQFAFVHVPKCAGTLVRMQLSYLDSYRGAFTGKVDHPALGRIDLAHLPLQVVADHFPLEFGKLGRYGSAALVRDPHERFLSALMQRLRLWRGASMSLVTREQVTREATAVMRVLEADPRLMPVPFTHFARQASFIEFEGRQVVSHLFPVGDLPRFARFVAERTGHDFDPARRENFSVAPARTWMRRAIRLARPIYRRILPQAVKNRLHTRMTQAGLYRRATDLHADMFGDETLRRFVADYYARDFVLYLAAAGDPDAAREAV